MDADRVAGGNDLGRECPVALDLLAEKEERRNRMPGVQRLQHGWSAVAVGPVVEGERNPAPGWKRARNPKRCRDRSHDGGGRGAEPRGRGCTG
jgi:hypothetical protein